MTLNVPDVPKAILDITQQAEDHNGALSSLIATKNRFEGWWQGTLVAGFARDPWNKQPGWDCAYGSVDSAELSIEVTVEVADGRLTFTRQTGRDSKRIDLAVKKGGPASMTHLIELKLLDGLWSANDQNPNLLKDAHALRAMVGWEDVASGWLVILGMRFADQAAFERHLDGIAFPAQVGRRFVAALQTHPECPCWMAALRFA